MGDFNAISTWDAEKRPDIVTALRAHPVGCNLTPDEGPRAIAQMERIGYVDTYRPFGEAGRAQPHPPETPIRIDYVFVSEPLAEGVRKCDIWQESPGQEASDHMVVVAQVELMK